jgi:hypothetical protein
MTTPSLSLRLTDVGIRRNRRRYTWSWRIIFLLLGFAVGWAVHGFIHQ